MGGGRDEKLGPRGISAAAEEPGCTPVRAGSKQQGGPASVWFHVSPPNAQHRAQPPCPQVQPQAPPTQHSSTLLCPLDWRQGSIQNAPIAQGQRLRPREGAQLVCSHTSSKTGAELGLEPQSLTLTLGWVMPFPFVSGGELYLHRVPPALASCGPSDGTEP